MTVQHIDSQWRVGFETLTAGAPGRAVLGAWPDMYSDVTDVSGLPPYFLVDPLDIGFGFVDGQVPAQLDPSTISLNVWARTVDDLPTSLQRGSICSWDLSLEPFIAGVPNPIKNPAERFVWAVSGGRITEAELELRPDSYWQARLSIKAVDMLSELAALAPAITDSGTLRRKARERLVQIAYYLGRTIGLPTGTPDGAAPAVLGGSGPGPRMNQAWLGNARDQLGAWCGAQDVIPAGIVVPWYDSTPLGSYPPGYGSCVPAVWSGPVLGQPSTQSRYMIAPSTKPSPSKLPLRLANVGGELQLTNAPETDQHTAALSGDYLEVPGTLRSGREHAPNLLRFTGTAEGVDVSVTPNTLVDRAAQVDYPLPDPTDTGPRARDVPTLLELGAFDASDTTKGNNINALLADYSVPYVPDAYALATSWAPDAIRVLVHAMSMATARAVIPWIVPSYPPPVGGTMDGVLIRHATLYRLPEGIVRAASPMIQGYVSSGRIHLEAGKMEMDITLQPGAAPGTGTRITVGDVDAASWHAIPAGNIDRSIRVSDLALVDA